MDIDMDDVNAVARRTQRRLTVPVACAAVLSVPAAFMVSLGGEHGLLHLSGTVLNWTTGAVLWLESVLLIALAKDKREFVRAHKWPILVGVLTIPAVLFAVGPAQVLRLVRLVGALRFLRVKQIVSAAQVLARRLRLRGRRGIVLYVAAGAVGAVFLALVISDAGRSLRELARWAAGNFGPLPAIGLAVVAGCLAVIAVRHLRRRRRRTEKRLDPAR